MKVLNAVSEICMIQTSNNVFSLYKHGVQSITRADSECLLKTEVAALTRYFVSFSCSVMSDRLNYADR